MEFMNPPVTGHNITVQSVKSGLLMGFVDLCLLDINFLTPESIPLDDFQITPDPYLASQPNTIFSLMGGKPEPPPFHKGFFIHNSFYPDSTGSAGSLPKTVKKSGNPIVGNAMMRQEGFA